MSNLPENEQPPPVPTPAPRRGGGRILIYAVVFVTGVAAAVGFGALYRADFWTAVQPFGPTASAYLDVTLAGRPSVQAYRSEDFERRKATFVASAKRSSVMEKAVTSKDIKQTPWYQESPEDAADRLAAAIRVSSIPETSLIAIRMSGAAPDDLLVIVNTVAKVFVESANAPARQVRFDQINALKKYTLEIRGELQVVYREMKSLRPAGAPDPRQTLDMLGKQLGVLATRGEELALARQGATQQLATFRQQDKASLLNTRPEVLRALKQDLALQVQVQRQEELRAERDAATKKLSPSHESVKELDIKLTVVNKLVEKRRAGVRSLTLKSLKNALERKVTDLDAQMKFVARRIAEGKEESMLLEESIAALDAKSARRQFLEKNLNTIERRRTELTLRRSADLIRIAQPAFIPE